MGYRYDINKVNVRVEASKVPQMLESLAKIAKEHVKNKALWDIKQNKARLNDKRGLAESYASRLNNEIKEFEEIIKSLPHRELSREEILENLEWQYFFDEDGTLSSLYHASDTRDIDEEELDAIAPFVSDGSYVEASGEDRDDLFRYVFRNGAMKRINAVISFPED